MADYISPEEYLASIRQAIANRPNLWAKYKKSLDMDSLLDRRNASLGRLNEKLDQVFKILDGHDSHCQRQCNRCKQEDKACQQISRRLLELDREQTQVLGELQRVRSKGFASMERETKTSLDRIVAERVMLQDRLCQVCGVCGLI